MLGIVTSLSTQGTTAYQPVDSQVQVKPSTEYIINTLSITSLKVFSANDSDMRIKLNWKEDRSPEFLLRVAETNAAIQALADVAAASNMVSLDVFLNEHSEDVMSYAEAADATSSATTKLFNVNEIAWVEENAAATMSLMLVLEGGNSIKKIFVDSNLAQIMDLITTGTTTTSS